MAEPGLQDPLPDPLHDPAQDRGGAAAISLAGRRLLVTRPRPATAAPAGDPLVAALTARGAEVLWLPALQLVPPLDWAALDESLRRLADFDWAIFTSQQAVAAVETRLASLRLNWASSPRAAAVGPKTAAALCALGRADVLVADPPRALGLLSQLLPQVRGRRFFWPRAEVASDALAEALRAAGAQEVAIATAYRAIAAEADAEVSSRAAGALAAGIVDAALFASGRSIEAALASLGPHARGWLEKVPKLCIGPVTAQACRDFGLGEPLLAGTSTLEGLADAASALLGPKPADGPTAPAPGPPRPPVA